MRCRRLWVTLACRRRKRASANTMRQLVQLSLLLPDMVRKRRCAETPRKFCRNPRGARAMVSCGCRHACLLPLRSSNGCGCEACIRISINRVPEHYYHRESQFLGSRSESMQSSGSRYCSLPLALKVGCVPSTSTSNWLRTKMRRMTSKCWLSARTVPFKPYVSREMDQLPQMRRLP